MDENKLTKKQLDNFTKELTNKYHQDKWMPYEDDIILLYYPQIQEWMEKQPRKSADIAFTAGLARQIARLIERAQDKEKQQERSRILKIINDEIKEWIELATAEKEKPSDIEWTQYDAYDGKIRVLSELKKQISSDEKVKP